MTKTRNFWNHTISTLWFVPSLLVIGGILLAFFFIGVDSAIGEKLGYFPRLFGIQPSGARDILAVIASSAITVAGTAFSITIVALTLASTQFSPRILRNFIRDTGNQIVLGILVGIFAYCIIVLRTIQDGGADHLDSFVPSVSVFFGVILGFVAIGSLIYFIHHVATSIQATSIISLIARETTDEIKKNFPKDEEIPKISPETAKILKSKSYFEINSNKTGYVQNADAGEMVKLAAKHDLIVKMQRRIGQFSIEKMPILHVFPVKKDFTPDDKLIEEFRSFYEIDDFRTVEGDVAFGIRQIVDIALKALSPAVNDTTTGVICVDYLSAIMSCLAKRPSCPSYLYDNGKLRLIIKQQCFEDFFDLAFNQIRQNAAGNVAIILRLLNSVNILSKINVTLPFKNERLERHEIMQTQARLLYELAEQSIKADPDLQTVVRYYQRIEKSLSERKSKIRLSEKKFE